MGKVRFPFNLPDVPTAPPLSPNPDITDDIQQTLATLVGFDGTARRVLRSTPTGILQTVNPLAKQFINIKDKAANYLYQGDDIKCSEVVVRADPLNQSNVWVNVYDTADEDKGWPLAANEHIVLSLPNLSFLHLKIITINEKVIIFYTQ